MRRSTGTVRLASSASRASSARGLRPPSRTGADPSRTSNGPRRSVTMEMAGDATRAPRADRAASRTSDRELTPGPPRDRLRPGARSWVVQARDVRDRARTDRRRAHRRARGLPGRARRRALHRRQPLRRLAELPSVRSTTALGLRNVARVEAEDMRAMGVRWATTLDLIERGGPSWASSSRAAARCTCPSTSTSSTCPSFPGRRCPSRAG